MALTYIINGKIVLPDSVVCGKALAFDSPSSRTDRRKTGSCRNLPLRRK